MMGNVKDQRSRLNAEEEEDLLFEIKGSLFLELLLSRGIQVTCIGDAELWLIGDFFR